MLRASLRLARTIPHHRKRCLATHTSDPSRHVRIVEVGPRDGLQNEPTPLTTAIKAELIDRLAAAGGDILESGSFVSPKWVPQMAGTADVLKLKKTLPNVRYPVLVPNMRGLEDLLALLEEQEASSPKSLPLTDEIAIFTATTDSFTQANTNTSLEDSLTRLRHVATRAVEEGLRVRGYVSMVIDCPFEGKVAPEKVKEVSEELLAMGCYEISLGDTTGSGSPEKWANVIEAVGRAIPVERLAAHTHDTFGMAVANVMQAVSMGIRTVDASVGGLGGCPYTPGATGNVATEDVLYALQNSSYTTSYDLEKVVDVGHWISDILGRPNASRVGRAVKSRRSRRVGGKEERIPLKGETVQAKL